MHVSRLRNNYLHVPHTFYVNYLGESCEKPRTDSLVKLKSDLEKKGIVYKCYNVIGDPNNANDVRYNAQNAADIIRPYQTGGIS